MKKKTYTVKTKRSRPRRNEWDQGKPGFRASRLAEKQRHRRRRKFIAILVGGAALAILLFAGIFLAMRSGDDSGGDSSASFGSEVSSVLIAVVNDAGELHSLLLADVGADAIQVVTIPSRTVAETPDGSFKRMEDVAAEGDEEFLKQTVATLVQHPVQYSLVIDFSSLLLAAEQVGTISLQFDREYSLTVGGEIVRLAAGPNPVASTQALSWLGAAAGDGTVGPQVQSAFFEGLREAFLARTEADRRAFAEQLFKRVRTDPGEDQKMGEDQFIDLFMLATASETSFSVVPIPARALGSGDDWYLEPIVGEMETLFGDAGESSHRLEVRNGTEKPGVVEWAAERLAPLGYETTQQPDVSGVNFEFTQIRYGSDAASAANDVRELLGTGTLIKDDILENDQIIVIIGLDLADVAAQGATINGM